MPFQISGLGCSNRFWSNRHQSQRINRYFSYIQQQIYALCIFFSGKQNLTSGHGGTVFSIPILIACRQEVSSSNLRCVISRYLQGYMQFSIYEHKTILIDISFMSQNNHTSSKFYQALCLLNSAMKMSKRRWPTNYSWNMIQKEEEIITSENTLINSQDGYKFSTFRGIYNQIWGFKIQSCFIPKNKNYITSMFLINLKQIILIS